VQIDDSISERLDMSSNWTEHENRLTLVDQSPSRREAKLAEIARKNIPALSNGRNKAGKEARDEGTLVADTQIEATHPTVPDDFAEPEPRRTPVVLYQPARLIAAQPVCEVIELVAVREDGGEANNAPLMRVGALKQPLDLDFVADLALVEADHMAFVEYQETNVVEEAGVATQCEVQLLGRCDHDMPLPDSVFVEPAHADATVKGRDGLSQRSESSLQGGLGLRG